VLRNQAAHFHADKPKKICEFLFQTTDLYLKKIKKNISIGNQQCAENIQRKKLFLIPNLIIELLNV